MRKGIERAGAALALMGALAGPAAAQVAPTYNAAQAARVTDGSARFRIYTGAEYNGALDITYQGMTEGNDSFLNAEHKLALGPDGSPVKAVAVARFGGTPSDPQAIERAFGLRFDLASIPGIDYGSLDLVRHDRIGDSYGGSEAILFLGREVGSGAVELYSSHKGGGTRYSELEALLPGRDLRGGTLRPFVRAEHGGGSLRDTVLIGGVQFQLK